MKKSILAVAILGAFAGAASAQSSVTLQGTLDLNARYIKNDGRDRNVSMGTDGLNSSQLVFSGTEDLGGGLAASFQLNSGLNPDTGSTNSSAKFFNRRSTVSLTGGFGEVRLGRDYTPTFWNNTLFDAFGTVGIANSLNVRQAPLASLGTFVRLDNAVSYFLPSKIGGVYGQVMVAASESAATNPGRYIGGRVGFAAGPFDVSAAAAEQRIDGPTVGKLKTYNVGGSYDLGVVKLLGYVNRDTLLTARETRGSFSVVVPMGQGEVHASYGRSKATDTNFDNSVSQFGLGYVYSLSKRTAVYSTVSRLNNGNASILSVGGVAPTLGNNSTGFEFGVRHFF